MIHCQAFLDIKSPTQKCEQELGVNEGHYAPKSKKGAIWGITRSRKLFVSIAKTEPALKGCAERRKISKTFDFSLLYNSLQLHICNFAFFPFLGHTVWSWRRGSILKVILGPSNIHFKKVRPPSMMDEHSQKRSKFLGRKTQTCSITQFRTFSKYRPEKKKYICFYLYQLKNIHWLYYI